MKKLLFVIILCASQHSGFCQLKASFAEDTINRIRFKDADMRRSVKINIGELNTDTVPNLITITALTGAPAIYRIGATTLMPSTGTSVMEIPVTILNGTNKPDPVYIGLELSYRSGTAVLKDTVVLKIENEKPQQKDGDDDSFFSKLMILNGYNFDFYGKLNSNYVGVFNIYEPARDRGIRKKWDSQRKNAIEINRLKWGVNAGIMKINYGLGENDSTNSYLYQNALIHPLDSIKPGGRYLRQYNKYTVHRTNSSWSFYVQPLLQLNSITEQKAGTRIYLHGHLELTVSKLTTQTVVTSMQTDTALIPNPIPSDFLIRYQPENEFSRTQTYYNGYFGAGFTFDMKLTNSSKSSLFLQGTIGRTTNRPNYSSVASFKGREIETGWYSFYLIRAAFNQRLSDATKLVIAEDIRGLFPNYNPLYATYIGLNIKLEDLLKLIKG